MWGNVTHKYGWGGEVQGGSPGVSTDITYSYTGNRRNGFSYDAAGNLTNDLGQNFTYDVTGQQTQASYSGYSLQQSYDGDGLRVKKSDNGVQTYYLRSSVLGGQVVAEINWFDVAWGWNRGYVYLGSQLLAVQQLGVYWMHEDPVTKSKRVTNSSGAIVSTIELDPWGADTNRSNNAAFQPKKFTSYERDGNGTDEAMFRRYNRWQSRFDQPDPYDSSYSLSDPQSFNRYAYVQGDPVNFVDPTGLVKCWDVGNHEWFECGPPDPERVSIDHREMRSLFGGYFLPASRGGRSSWAGLFSLMPFPAGGPAIEPKPQNPRPKKETAFVKVVPEKNTPTCVEHEWGVFNRKVEAIKAAAEMHFEERELPGPIKWLQAIASGIGGDDRIDPTESAADRFKDSVPDIINIMAREKEIEEGTQQAANLRDQRIKENCKKP